MHKPVVVIVDRDRAALEVIGHILRGAGWEVVSAESHRTAYSRIMELLPELILLDIHLHQPRAGWVLVDLLRAHSRTRAVPIIVCSGDTAFLHAKANRLRAKGCLILHRPFEPAQLLALAQQAYPREIALGQA